MPLAKRGSSVAGRRSQAASRSKSTAGRRRGEEVLEIPNTAQCADGQRHYFVGGFSKHTSISSLYDISKEKDTCGNEVVVLPGTYSPDEESTAADNNEDSTNNNNNNNSRPTSSSSSSHPMKKGEIGVRSLEIRAFHPPSTAPQSKVVNFAEPDQDDADGNNNNEDYDGDNNNGDDGTGNNGANQLEQILAPTQPPIVRDVIFTGDATFVKFVTPSDASPLAALAPEQSLVPSNFSGNNNNNEREPRNVRAMSMRSTASKKSIASTEDNGSYAAGLLARESETPSAAQTAMQEDEGRGVKPSTWPTITFNGISFERGMITLKTVHAEFEKCHFSVPNASYFVQVMPYCRATFIDCTFSAPSKASIYGFPFSNITCKQCHFSGLDLLAIQDDRDSIEQLAADRLDQSSRGMINNVGLLADDAIINLDNCHFLHLTHGVVLQNRCSGSKIKKCVFECIDGSAAFFGKGSQPLFTRNLIAGSCTGRGVYFDKGSKPKASQNQVASRVVISNGSAPALKGNHFSVRIEEQNDIANPYMDPKY